MSLTWNSSLLAPKSVFPPYSKEGFQILNICCGLGYARWFSALWDPRVGVAHVTTHCLHLQCLPLSYRIKWVSASKALRTVPDKCPAFSKCYQFLLPPPCPPLDSSLSGMSSFPELHPISPLLFCSPSDTERRENGKRINYKSIKPEPPQAQTVPLNKLEKIIPSKRMKSRDRVPGLVGRVQGGFQPPTSASFTPSAWHSCAVNSLHKWTW